MLLTTSLSPHHRRSARYKGGRLKIMQHQAGHGYASTTAIYTGVSDESRNRLLQKKLAERHPGLWEDPT